MTARSWDSVRKESVRTASSATERNSALNAPTTTRLRATACVRCIPRPAFCGCNLVIVAIMLDRLGTESGKVRREIHNSVYHADVARQRINVCLDDHVCWSEERVGRDDQDGGHRKLVRAGIVWPYSRVMQSKSRLHLLRVVGVLCVR